MSRKHQAPVREVLPDPRYGDILITKVINALMYDGKKSTSYDVFYDAVEIIQKRTEQDGLEMFKKALSNVTPAVEVRSRRVGGATFQIPSEIRPERKTSMGIKWMILYARKRNEKSMSAKLAGEIIAAAKEEGAAFKKKEDVHKMAEANKAFSHFRF